MKCPLCDQGILKKRNIKEEMFGIELGEFPARICSRCGESFTDEETTIQIQEVAKQKGIWGLEKKNYHFANGKFLGGSHPAAARPLSAASGMRSSVYSSG